MASAFSYSEGSFPEVITHLDVRSGVDKDLGYFSSIIGGGVHKGCAVVAACFVDISPTAHEGFGYLRIVVFCGIGQRDPPTIVDIVWIRSAVKHKADDNEAVVVGAVCEAGEVAIILLDRPFSGDRGICPSAAGGRDHALIGSIAGKYQNATQGTKKHSTARYHCDYCLKSSCREGCHNGGYCLSIGPYLDLIAGRCGTLRFNFTKQT